MKTAVSYKIESNDLSIAEILKDFYSVPDFQREYVWERQHVDKLVQDVLEEFYDENGQLRADTEYFLGSIVACRDEQGIYRLIDGQQRMTTIYLVLCAARDVLRDAGEGPTRVLQSQLSDVYSDPKTGEDVERHRLTLQYEDSDGILEELIKTRCRPADVQASTGSAQRILSAHGAIREFFVVDLCADVGKIKKFLVAFTGRVKLIRILTPTIANALKVFETINDRGVGLNAMDLLKNLLFMKISSTDYSELKDRWKELIDTLANCQEKPLRFLRYYIMSHHTIDYGRGIREDEIYDWFVKNASTCGIDDDPLGFVETLIECARAHSNFLGAQDVRGKENRYLNNLSRLSGSVRQQHILLLAARHLSADLFDELCRSLENLFFCYIITREPTKTFERNFARWSSQLRACHDRSDLESFLGKHFGQDMRRRSERFDFALTELTEWGIQKYRMRYILAKLTQYIEDSAWDNRAQTDLGFYMDRSVHVEHILSQTPAPEDRSRFDKPDEYDEYVVRLGNLALLENTINSSISNDRYEKKKVGYAQSAFLLTKALTEKPRVGHNTRLNRAVKDLSAFDVWNSGTIIERQGMLVELARKVWGMPVVRTEMAEEELISN